MKNITSNAQNSQNTGSLEMEPVDLPILLNNAAIRSEVKRFLIFSEINFFEGMEVFKEFMSKRNIDSEKVLLLVADKDSDAEDAVYDFLEIYDASITRDAFKLNDLRPIMEHLKMAFGVIVDEKVARLAQLTPWQRLAVSPKWKQAVETCLNFRDKPTIFMWK